MVGGGDHTIGGGLSTRRHGTIYTKADEGKPGGYHKWPCRLTGTKSVHVIWEPMVVGDGCLSSSRATFLEAL